MCTRRCDNIKPAKEYKDGTVRCDPRRHAFLSTVEELIEPLSHHEAMQNPKWKHVVDGEFGALILSSRTRHGC